MYIYIVLILFVCTYCWCLCLDVVDGGDVYRASIHIYIISKHVYIYKHVYL